MKSNFTKLVLLALLFVAVQGQAQTVVINEFMASNDTTAADADGEFDDWIELYNVSNSVVDLSGWYITDKTDNLTKFQLPSGITMQPAEYLIIWADEDSIQGTLHANFKLSAGGEAVILSDNLGQIVDSVTYWEQSADVGYARLPNGTGAFVLQAPTFNSTNSFPISTKNLAAENTFSIFPNPASRFLTIEIKEEMANNWVEVFDAQGKKLDEISINSNTIQVDVAKWDTGFYIFKYGEQVKKLLILK
jgi:hypothetical protein